VGLFLILLILIQKAEEAGSSARLARGGRHSDQRLAMCSPWATSIRVRCVPAAGVVLNVVGDHYNTQRLTTPGLGGANSNERTTTPVNPMDQQPRHRGRTIVCLGTANMIVSMTGFRRRHRRARTARHYGVEARSLNKPFFKPIIKLPEPYRA